MSNDYPFSPYPDPFSPLTPEPPQAQQQPVSWSAQQQQPAQPTEHAPAWPPPAQEPAPQFSPPEDTGDEAIQKTALAIVAGVLVLLILVGFGVWYFLRDKGEAPTSDSNLILASTGGKITTPEGAVLIIPPGALSQDTRLEISKVRDGDVTDLFELKPLGQKFLKPVTVEIPYKKSGPIILEYWKEEGGERRDLKFIRNEKRKKLRTEVAEF